ncbi:DUF885 family protein [Kitasatospora aburaviensis]
MAPWCHRALPVASQLVYVERSFESPERPPAWPPAVGAGDGGRRASPVRGTAAPRLGRPDRRTGPPSPDWPHEHEDERTGPRYRPSGGPLLGVPAGAGTAAEGPPGAPGRDAAGGVARRGRRAGAVRRRCAGRGAGARRRGAVRRRRGHRRLPGRAGRAGAERLPLPLADARRHAVPAVSALAVHRRGAADLPVRRTAGRRSVLGTGPRAGPGGRLDRRQGGGAGRPRLPGARSGPGRGAYHHREPAGLRGAPGRGGRGPARCTGSGRARTPSGRRTAPGGHRVGAGLRPPARPRRRPSYLREAPPEVGWARYRGGEEAYREFVRTHTGDGAAPERLHELGRDQCRELAERMREVRTTLGFPGPEEEFHDRLRTEPRLYARTPEEVEARFRGHLDRLAPVLPRWFAALPAAPYGLARLDPALEAGMTFGYYEPPTAAGPIGRYRYNGSDLDRRSLLGSAS